MLKMNIKLAREAGKTKRYHMVNTIKEESVAEHSFNVVNLVLILSEGKASRSLILAALTHDMGETAIGDIPSQIKKMLSFEAREELCAKEQEAIDRIHPHIHANIDADEKHLLEICDNLDGLLKCIDELKMGNQHIIPVGERYSGYLQDLIEHDPAHRLEVECVISEFRSRYLK